MNGWSRRDIIALLGLIAGIGGIGITFFQDEIKCATGLSCADNSRSTVPTVPPAIQPGTAGTQPGPTPEIVEKGMSGSTVPTVPPAIQPQTAGTQPTPIPICAEAEMAAQRASELKNKRSDLERRIAHMKCIAAQADCSKDWNQGRTCYLEGRLLSRAEFDREIARMKLMIRQIK